ncbi:MAG TPA: polysaccharide deacetylase family protein [Gemmatimonadaceae bacterium]|nr:polysaccharide deacetylase family protein [Gemmatimonadaceae bacterium]
MKAILTYHSIDPSGSPISVDAAVFHAHVRWLASGAVRVVSIPELVRLADDVDAVALTFDDGFESFGAVAAPLLLEHGLPATLFVVADRAGATNAWGGVEDPAVPTLPLLGWEALRRLAAQGITLGAHTRSHPRLTALPAAARREEIAGSVARIAEETGVRPTLFAYPYGDVDDEVAAEVAAHCDWACTTELRALGAAERPHRLPRLDMYYLREPGRLEAWGTPGFRRHLWLRARARDARRRLAAVMEHR